MPIASSGLRMWGRFEHSLDDKGRVVVPLKFRDKLGDEFVLTTGADHHIRVYPMPIWENMEEQLISQDVHDEQDPNLNFLQRLFGNCEYVSSDQQNRLSLSRHLRVWAGLGEDETAIIIGNGTRLEIWSRTNWEKQSEKFTAAEAAKASSQRKLEERERQGITASGSSVDFGGNSVPTPNETETT